METDACRHRASGLLRRQPDPRPSGQNVDTRVGRYVPVLLYPDVLHNIPFSLVRKAYGTALCRAVKTAENKDDKSEEQYPCLKQMTEDQLRCGSAE